MTIRSQNRYVVATHYPSLDTQGCLGLWLRPQFFRTQRLWHKPPRQPPRLRRRQRTRRSQAQNAVRNGVAGEPSAGRSAAPDARSGGKSDAQDATSEGMLATAPRPPQRPPSKKNSPFIRPAQEPGRLTGGPGSPYRSPPAPGGRHTGASRASLPAFASVVRCGNALARQASVHAQGFMNSDL